MSGFDLKHYDGVPNDIREMLKMSYKHMDSLIDTINNHKDLNNANVDFLFLRRMQLSIRSILELCNPVLENSVDAIGIWKTIFECAINSMYVHGDKELSQSALAYALVRPHWHEIYPYKIYGHALGTADEEKQKALSKLTQEFRRDVWAPKDWVDRPLHERIKKLEDKIEDRDLVFLYTLYDVIYRTNSSYSHGSLTGVRHFFLDKSYEETLQSIETHIREEVILILLVSSITSKFFSKQLENPTLRAESDLIFEEYQKRVNKIMNED